MLSSTAQMIGTVAIWLAVGTIMTRGVCKMNFDGPEGLAGLTVISACVCGGALVATGFVWGRIGDKSAMSADPELNRQTH